MYRIDFHRGLLTNIRPGFSLSLETLLGRIDAVADARAMFRTFTAAGGPCVITFVNANTVTVCARNQPGLRAVCAADHVLRDGIGVAIAARLRGCRPGLNMNGTDLIPMFLKGCRRRRVALY